MASGRQSASWPSLESLPLLILELIAEYLSHTTRDRRDLFAFALTSKYCHAVSNRERFRRIHLEVGRKAQLKELLAGWDEILNIGKRERRNYVRSIKVTGYMESEELDHIEKDYNRRYWRLMEGWDSELGEAVESERYSHLRKESECFSFDNKPENKSKRNELWRPLADFISAFPGLKDLTWSSTDQLSRCILDVLHLQLPRARLHVHTFYLRSLNQPKDELHAIDEDERALATSPSLHSVRALPNHNHRHGMVNYNEEALQDIVNGAAPNLREIELWDGATKVTGMNEVPRRRRSDCLGLSSNINNENGVMDKYSAQKGKFGELTKVSLLDWPWATTRFISSWAQRTDFSVLRSLDLGGGPDMVDLEQLILLANKGALKSLRSLALSQSDEQQTQSSLLPELLTALTPLEDLKIRTRTARVSMEAISGCHHTSSLRTLTIETSSLDPLQIRALREQCFNLQKLSLPISRIRSREEEIQIYTTLGSFPRLSHLTLKLDSTIPYIDIRQVPKPKERKAQQATRYKTILAARALDAPVSLSIYNLIAFPSSCQTKPVPVPTLLHLKLINSINALREPNLYVTHLTRYIARHWVCSYVHTDTHTGEPIITAREIGVKNRELRGEALKMLEYGDLDVTEVMHLRRVWEDLWPAARSKPTDQWFEFWEGLPLKQDVVGDLN